MLSAINSLNILIVAECNVNFLGAFLGEERHFILIVAECNVNIFYWSFKIVIIIILIVAECNVNVSALFVKTKSPKF